jgi:hypothetical protein
MFEAMSSSHKFFQNSIDEPLTLVQEVIPLIGMSLQISFHQNEPQLPATCGTFPA